MVTRKLHPDKFFTEDEKNRIVEAIRQAESRTSGEIRVYLEHKSKANPLARARKVFEQLGMTKTKLRNGVLVYFSLHGRQFAVLGDRGIHDRVGDDFWRRAVSEMQRFFTQGDFVKGLETGILLIGGQLGKYFPPAARNVNELPDEISE